MIGFALFGCGKIAQRYALLLTTQFKGARLVCVYDQDHQKMIDFSRKWDVEPVASLADLKAHKDVNLICVLTPSGLHGEHVLLLADSGKDLLVEKPMALRLDDARRMINACANYDCRLFVVMQNRFNVPMQALKQAIDDDELGRLQSLSVRVRWCRPEHYYKQASWRGTWQYDGGVIANQASHHIDMLAWIGGEVESVYAQADTMLAPIEAEDTAVVVLKFKNGALGLMEASTAIRPVDIEGSFSVMASKASVEVGGFSMDKLSYWHRGDGIDESDSLACGLLSNPDGVSGYGHQKYLENLISSLNNGHPGMVEGDEGFYSLRLIKAIYQSIERKQTVFVDEVYDDSDRLGRQT
jgi:UDP-N-acetyl-2-amino-2-deoxyglucuronate dehydrogenase